MKKILLLMALAALTLGSCYKDKSTDASIATPSIALLNGDSDLSFTLGEQVEWTPELAFQHGLDLEAFKAADYDDYDYQWRMTRSTNPFDTTRVTVSTGKSLKTKMDFMPTPGDTKYNMGLYMRNKHTGMLHSIFWNMKVLSSFGAGLLVADTRDESTSDISLIKSYHYNNSLWTANGTLPDQVLRNVYSEFNGGTMTGIISQLAYVGAAKYQEIAALVKGKSLTRIDPLSMKATAKDDQLFFYKPETWNPQMVFSQPRNMYQNTIMVNDGRPHFYRTEEMLGQYSPTVPADLDFEIQPGIFIPVMISSTINALMWDKAHSRIMAFNGSMRTTPAIGAAQLQEAEAGSLFNPNDLSGFECLYAGYIASYNNAEQYAMHRTAWLLKEQGSGGLRVYELDTSEVPPNYDFIVRGTGIFDMSACTDLASATCYVTSQDYREFFYAAGNKLYVAILTPGVAQPTAKVVFEAAAGQTITHLDMDQCRSGRTYWMMMGTTPMGVPSQNTLMTIATWDGTEGRVYAVPRSHAGSGEMAPAQYRSMWGGFGRITAINVCE